MADSEIIKRIALKTGLGINYISKDAKISDLLEQLRVLFKESPLILKGGTAINRGYFKAPKRFSEDLDFDFISPKPLDEKINQVKGIVAPLKDFQLGRPAIVHRTLRFDCHYENEFQRKDTIRLEFYFSHTKIVAVNPPKEELLTSNLETTKASLFTIYSLEDLLARKLMALLNRTEGRDIYDAFFLLDLDYNLIQLKKAIDLLLKAANQNMLVEEFIDAILKVLEQSLEHASYIGNSTNHFLIKTYRPNWSEFISTLLQKIELLKAGYNA